MTNATIEATTVETLVSVREATTAEIHINLEVIGQAYMKVGALLIELRGDFDNQKDFLVYVEGEFGIKKSQAFNLMNVARTFDGEPRFSGVSMRVMLALTPLADEAAIMEEAATLAAQGLLTIAAVNKLAGKPEKAPTPAATQPQAVAPKAPEVGAQAASGDDSAPWEDGDNTVTLQSVPAAPADDTLKVDAPKAEPLDTPTNAENAIHAGLLAQIASLTEQLQAANNRMAELTSTRETKKHAAPMLPQFKSKCMYARLGLSAEEAEKKAAVNKAKRELAKLGYGEGHEAWALISEAVEALTA